MHLRNFVQIICHALLLVAVTGCGSLRSSQLRAPQIVKPAASGCGHLLDFVLHRPVTIEGFDVARMQAATHPSIRSSTELGEKSFALAERLHAEGDDRAVDYWARSVAWMDDALRRSSQGDRRLNCSDRDDRAARVRQSAAIRILACGQAYGRLQSASHLLINGLVRTYRIPVVRKGFVWKPHDFQKLLVFEPPSNAHGNISGQGVPLVVLTAAKPSQQTSQSKVAAACFEQKNEASCDSFLQSQTPFAATALLHFPVAMFQQTNFGKDHYDEEVTATVTLVNPLVVDPESDRHQLAQSPAMPLIYARESSKYNPLSAFVNSDNGVDRPKLLFLEPYQADKIPLILVHGLLSNPATFLEVADAVRADPWLRKRYQIWIVRYPTGDEFLRSAAVVRKQLADAFNCCNANARQDNFAETHHPVERAVIVGHSLGGLMSKLQVINSGDRLWRSIANTPLDQLRGSPSTLAEIRQAFEFQANPNIGRIVYIATPHRGSPWASRCIGRVAASLSQAGESEEQAFQEILYSNPGVLSGAYSESLPSSVELMRPSDALLQALAATPTAPDVVVNSIVGDYIPLPRAGPSDGVVPMESAFLPEAETTTIVDASHSSIQKSTGAQQELLMILRKHLCKSFACE